MDRITNSLMREFQKSMEIERLKDSDLFEVFATYSVISKILDGDFEVSDIVEDETEEGKTIGVVSGGGGDTGIDGIAITLNGNLITDISEVKDIFEDQATIFEANLIFVQAKTSSKFEGKEIRNFGDGIVDFLSTEPKLVQNDFIHNRWNIVNEIIHKAGKIQNINCKAYYVTTGTWNPEDKNLVSKIESSVQDIKELSIFNEITFDPIGAEILQEMYKSSQIKLMGEVHFPKKVLLPDILHIDEAYIGYIQVEEYLKLIKDDLGNLRKSIFYDNVRDYQGDNAVNTKISNTLESNTAERLAILNNGVTIIADKIQPVRENIILSNYQIVNGCQTSYVIYYNRENINEKVFLPIKVISTTDETIVNEIIIANNSQTEVKKEELMALTAFQKKLESYYDIHIDKKKKLYYERRSKQFDNSSSVEKVRIVTISNQLRSFCGMFLDIPHMSSRYYGKLFKEYSTKAFDVEYNLSMFYTSAFALYKLEYLIRNKSIAMKYRKFKYHILMLLRYHVSGDSMPAFNSKKKMDDYCEKINKVMWDNTKACEEFQFLIDIIDETVDDIMSNEITSKKYLNDDLLQKLKEKIK